MRWKLWDSQKDGIPPQYAVIYNDGSYTKHMVLQQRIETGKTLNYEGDKFNGWTSHYEWEDVPLHIEGKT